MRLPRGAVLLTGLGTLLSACRDPVPPPPIETKKPVAALFEPTFQGPAMTLDDHLEDLGRMLPGFGGLDVQGGKLVVYLTDPASQQELARTRVPAFLARLNHPLGEGARLPIEFRRGKFTFDRLAQWHRAFNERGVPDGLVFDGIDKGANALTFGVRDAGAAAKLMAVLSALGIERDAYSIEITEPSRPAQNYLWDNVRPTIGGLQIQNSIWHAGTGAYQSCTLGANVTRSSSPGDKFMLTASHCSTKMFGLDPDTVRFHQPRGSSITDEIGIEAVDPPLFTGSPCPVNRRCRRSDAMLVIYSDPTDADIGTVARANSFWQITDYGYYSGSYGAVEPMYKTGVATSTTSALPGTISYCLNQTLDSASYAQDGVIIPRNVTLICQTRYGSMMLNKGDSGGPVFARGLDTLYQNRWDIAKFRGIMHSGSNLGTTSGYKWGSEWEQIKWDLGNLAYWP